MNDELHKHIFGSYRNEMSIDSLKEIAEIQKLAERKSTARFTVEFLSEYNFITDEERKSLMQMIHSEDEENLTVAEAAIENFRIEVKKERHGKILPASQEEIRDQIRTHRGEQDGES